MDDGVTCSTTRLAADLASMGLSVEESPAGLRVGERGSPPTVWVTVTDDGLNAYVEHGSSAAEAVFPDVSPLVGSYRLLLANIDGYVTAGAPGLKGIDIGPRDVSLHRAPEQRPLQQVRDTPGEEPNDDLGWLADPTAL